MISRVMRRITILITLRRVRVTLLMTTHEPPSRAANSDASKRKAT